MTNAESEEILEELHEDEKEIRRYEKWVKIAFSGVSVLILFLFVGISYLAVQLVQSKRNTETIVNVVSPSVTQTPAPTPELTQIPISTSENSSKKSGSKDYYINIGSGSSQSLDWTDVPGALTTADIAAYEDIKEVHFEAFINVPTANGKVSVRLFNKTDNYAVWNSEVTRDGTRDNYQFISPALIYDRGPRLYQVQMKSQLNVLINLVNARIRVQTE